MKIHLFVASVLGCLLGTNALAYHIGDHEVITEQAFKEISQCFPQSAESVSLRWLVTGDRDEDTNLFEKWLYYSHYFNPYKHLDMRRGDSLARIDELTPRLTRVSDGRFSATEAANLGHVIHHFQDATVPAHVVPVDHSLWDGFETFKFTGDISSGLSCDQIGDLWDTDLDSILRETAIETLAIIRNGTVAIAAEDDGFFHKSIEASLSVFWEESKDNEFGHYGFLGNNFGSHVFTKGGTRYDIPENFASDFKQQQMRRAVVATLRGLMWQLGPQIIREKNKSEPVVAHSTAVPAQGG